MFYDYYIKNNNNNIKNIPTTLIEYIKLIKYDNNKLITHIVNYPISYSYLNYFDKKISDYTNILEIIKNKYAEYNINYYLFYNNIEPYYKWNYKINNPKKICDKCIYNRLKIKNNELCHTCKRISDKCETLGCDFKKENNSKNCSVCNTQSIIQCASCFKNTTNTVFCDSCTKLFSSAGGGSIISFRFVRFYFLNILFVILIVLIFYIILEIYNKNKKNKMISLNPTILFKNDNFISDNFISDNFISDNFI